MKNIRRRYIFLFSFFVTLMLITKKIIVRPTKKEKKEKSSETHDVIIYLFIYLSGRGCLTLWLVALQTFSKAMALASERLLGICRCNKRIRLASGLISLLGNFDASLLTTQRCNYSPHTFGVEDEIWLLSLYCFSHLASKPD